MAPTPVSLPGESQGQRSLAGCRLWGCTDSATAEATQQQQQQSDITLQYQMVLTCLDVNRPQAHMSPLQPEPLPPPFPSHPSRLSQRTSFGCSDF